MCIAAAIVGSAVVGAGASAVASNKASKAQGAAASQATGAQMSMYNQTREDLSPYREFGAGAMGKINNLLGINGSPQSMMATLSAMPGYQFSLNQGLRGVQNAAAARGLGSSGAALKGAANFATGLANNNYSNYFNQLMGVAGMGQNAAAQTGAYGTATAQSVGQNYIGAGNAAAAGALGVGNSINNAANSMGGLYMTNALLQQSGYPGLWGGGGSGIDTFPLPLNGAGNYQPTNILG